MTENSLITKITDIIIEKTVKQKIPTIVFLSNVDKGTLVKNLLSKLCGYNEDIFATPSFTPWTKTAEVMQKLAEIPLLVDEIIDIEVTKNKINDFINELKNSKGLVIINSDKIYTQEFTISENTSIIVVND